MRVQSGRDKRIRKFGLIWLLLAPVVLLMAAVSTVRSEVTYFVQLAAFSAVAIAAVIFAVGALLQRSWAAVGLLVLSWLGATFFFGAAVLAFLWPFLPWSRATTDVAALPLAAMLALLIAPPGIPFLLMARGLGRLVKSLREEAGGDDA